MDVTELRVRDWFEGIIRAQERGTVVRKDEFEDTDEEHDGFVVIPEVWTDDDDDDDDKEKFGYEGYSEDDGEDKGEDNNDLKDIKIITLRYQSTLDRLIFEYIKGISAVFETFLKEGEGDEYSGFPYRLLG